jgi:hypothetical protein
MREWIKLYTEIVNDRKMCLLSDRQFRVCVNLFALAGIVDDGGILPPLDDMAFQLRVTEQDLMSDLRALARANILLVDDGVWMVAHWRNRQAKPPSDMPEAILARVKKHRAKTRNETVTPLQDVTKNVTPVTFGNEPCNAVTTREREREEKEPIPAYDPFPKQLPEMPASAGRNQAAKLQELNGKVSPELRTPLANVMLDMTGKRALADAGDETLLYDAHTRAAQLYLAGYKTETALLALEPAWAEDWRGKGGGGTLRQLAEFASEHLPSNRSNGHTPPVDNEMDWTSDPQMANYRSQHATT